MSFSVGILYSVQTLLAVVKEGGLHIDTFAASFGKIEVADGASVLSAAQRCRWIAVESGGAIKLTERGDFLRGITEAHLCLREQLLDLIAADAPPWSKKIMYGRFEALKAMPDPARQCFEHCRLMEGEEEATVDWWDKASNSVRAERTRANHEVGRAAEKLTIQLEYERTGKRPVWQALETSVSGFDVLSVVKPDTSDKLMIEVKGSRLPRKEASFYLTRNEWNTACASRAFHFHLWLLRDSNATVLVVPSKELERHVPRDGETGRWETAQLYFKEFVSFEYITTDRNAER